MINPKEDDTPEIQGDLEDEIASARAQVPMGHVRGVLVTTHGTWHVAGQEVTIVVVPWAPYQIPKPS